MRQRNIPTNDTVSSEVQTDINLIHQPIIYDIERLGGTHLSELENVSHILKGETDSQLLSFFRQQASFFKGLGSLENVPAEEMRKRLLWIQQQIEGLEKRQLIVNGLHHSDYYTIVSQLQGKLDKQYVINNNYEPKLREAQIKIDELQKEIQLLRRSVIQQQNYKEQCQLYEEAFKKVSQITKDQRKMRELQKTMNDTVIPLINEYQVKIDTMMKNLSNIGRSSNDPKYKLKGHINGLLRNFDKIIKSTGQMTLENIEKYIAQFLKQLQISSTFQNYQQGKSYKHRYIDLDRRYNAAVSMFKNKFQSILEQNPNLKNQLDLSLFNLLQKQGVNLYCYDRVITIENIGQGYKTAYYQSQERTKKLLGLLVGQFKNLLKIFPLVRQHLSSQLLEVLNLEIFEDAIALQQIQRIFEVVKYKTEVVKVQNVYTYNNEANLKTIFHLKIMIKALLDELQKVKDKTGIVLEIDEGLLGMIKSQIIEYINPDDVLSVFRTCPKILEVEKIVQRDLTRYKGTLTEAHPINIQSLKLAETVIERPIILKEQVGIVIEKGIPLVAIHQKPIEVKVQRVVQVPVQKQVIVEKTIFDQRLIEVDVLKQVPLIQQQIKEVEVPVTQQVIVEVPQIVKTQIAVATKQIVKEIVQVERLEERIVQVVKQVTNIKQIKVVQQVPIQINKYIEVEKIINNFINVPQVIEVKEQIPITITNTIQKQVQTIETVEKIVQVRTVDEKILEVPVQKVVNLIQQVPKPYKETQTVFVKGDKQEVIVEIQRVVQKPLIQEVVVTKQINVEKVVPLVVKQQIPVVVQLNQPYIQNQVQIVSCEVEKIVPYKEEIPFEVVKQIPVPIICQKEIVKPVRVIVQKVIQTMVQVPRVVEVQKIVEKIVVVPRIVQKVVMVPQIVQKIVERQVQVLKIIEVQVPVIEYITKQVQQIVQEKVQVPIERVIYNTVERQKLIVTNTETQVLKQVQTQKQIPYQVIREREVPFLQQKLIEKIVTINNVQIKEKQVMVPVKYQVPVEIIQEKPVQVKKIIETVVQVPQIVTKNVVLYETKTIPEIHEIIVQKPIEVVKQVVYTNINNVIQKQVEYRDILKQVVVKETERIEIIKPEPYFIEKIVVVTNVEQQGVQIKVQKGVPYRVDNIVVVEKPIAVPVIHEVPKVINVQKIVELRSIHESIKQVAIEGKQKIIALQTIKPQIVQITKEVVKVLVQHQQKQVYQQVAVMQQHTTTIQVPSKPIIVQEIKQIYRQNTEPLLMQKIIQRVTILPQIVEVLKHIHEISEERIDNIGLGIAGLGVDVQVHTSNYINLCTNLRKGLQSILLSIKNAKSPQAKSQVVLIQQLIALLGDLIRFPNIIQIPKEVQKIVEVQKAVVIPTRDNVSITRQIASNTLIEKLLAQLKRVKNSGIQLKLDQDVLNTFFFDTRGIDNLKDKLGQFGSVVVNRFKSLGEWTDKHSLMLSNFLEQRFLMAGLVKQSNKTIQRLKQKLETSQTSRKKYDNQATRLSILNLSLKNSLDQVKDSLTKSQRLSGNSNQQVQLIVRRITQTLNLVNTTNLSETSQILIQNSSSGQVNKLRKELSGLQKEIESHRGGQAQRTRYLDEQNKDLKNELERSKLENIRLKTSLNETYLQDNSRQRIIMTTRVEDLNRLLTQQKQQYDKTVLKLKEQFEKRIQQRSGDVRVITSTIDRSVQEEKLRALVKQLQARIRQLEYELANVKNRESRMTADIQRRTIQIEDLKRRWTDRETMVTENLSVHNNAEDQRMKFTLRQQESKIKQLKDNLGRSTNELAKSNATANKYRSELEKSQIQQSRLMTQLKRKAQQVQGMRVKLSESQVYKSAQRTTFRTNDNEDSFKSPQVRHISHFNIQNINTPADQLKESKTPQVEQYQFSQSSGTDKKNIADIQYKTLTLEQLIKDGTSSNETISTQIIIKLCEKLQTSAKMKIILFYSPVNIRLIDFSPDDFSQLKIQLGAPIKRKDASENQKLYLCPEVLLGQDLSERSSVFNVGLIWDEMLHGNTFFKTSNDIQSPTVEYKVRNLKLNPIFKNALFEMLAKQINKRQEFSQIRRRLSLQRFITHDEKKK